MSVMSPEVIDKITELNGANHQLIFENTEWKIIMDRNCHEHVIRKCEPAGRAKFGAVTGDIESFCAHLTRFFDQGRTIIAVGPKGATARFWKSAAGSESEPVETDKTECTMSFFAADMPTSNWMRHGELMEYFDQHQGKICGLLNGGAAMPEHDLIDVLRMISVVKGEKTISDAGGASVNVQIVTDKKVESSLKVEIPRIISISLRRGVREFECEHRFRLHISTDGPEVQFRLVHMKRDGAEEAFMDYAIGEIRERLNGNTPEKLWHIIKSA